MNYKQETIRHPLGNNLIQENTWKKVLDPLLETPHCKQILRWIAEQRNVISIYPEPENIFRAFELCPITELKVIWLGLDPYINGEATGISMGINPGTPIPPTLRAIKKEFETDLGHSNIDLSFEKYAAQGILYLNVALTVAHKATKSHLELWKPFTEHIFRLLNLKKNLVYVLLGSDAQHYLKFINVQNNYIIKLPHPMREIYSPGAGFYGSKLFTRINSFLENKIEWDSTKIP